MSNYIKNRKKIVNKIVTFADWRKAASLGMDAAATRLFCE